VIKWYFETLTVIMEYFEMEINLKGNFSQMLDSIRGSLLGRPNFPHQHFIARGAHSITLFSHGGKNSGSNVKDLIWLLEKLVRIHD
jgi:hypothetical protein